MTASKQLKVSYCTTCKGRLHHLKETLPKNLAAEKGNPNVEFVVLDYDSPDGLGSWIQENYAHELETGRIKYVRYEPASHFKMAHAKNMAHRMASGDILCNLDADNVIAPNSSKWLQQEFKTKPHAIFTHHPVTLPALISTRLKSQMDKVMGRPEENYGIGGRIAVSRENYYSLNGYNEQFTGWDSDDLDFVTRATQAGLIPKAYPKRMHGSVIAHTDEARIAHMSDKDRAESKQRLGISDEPLTTKVKAKLIRSKKRIHSFLNALPQANPEGNVGCGAVTVNFDPASVEIKRLMQEKLPVLSEYEVPVRTLSWGQEIKAQQQNPGLELPDH